MRHKNHRSRKKTVRIAVEWPLFLVIVSPAHTRTHWRADGMTVRRPSVIPWVQKPSNRRHLFIIYIVLSWYYRYILQVTYTCHVRQRTHVGVAGSDWPHQISVKEVVCTWLDLRFLSRKNNNTWSDTNMVGKNRLENGTNKESEIPEEIRIHE